MKACRRCEKSEPEVVFRSNAQTCRDCTNELRRQRRSGDFPVESGIAIPKKGNAVRYPFAEMEVGDSFTCSKKDYLARVSQAATHSGRKLGRKFTARSQGAYVRIWRIE